MDTPIPAHVAEWWNSLDEKEQAHWLRCAGTDSVFDAWMACKKSAEPPVYEAIRQADLSAPRP